MLQLRFTSSSKPPVWLVAPKYTIGSDEECDCFVPGEGVAQKHAELSVDEERLTVSKLDAEASIFVNGVLLLDDICELKHGDSLTIGSTDLDIFDPKLLRTDNDWLADEDEVDIEWSLLAMNSALGNRRFPIEGQVLLGRSKDCDISLAVTHLSRKHARLSITPTGLLVEDLQSSNGTFVNGKKIQQSLLKPGDELGFDTLKFKICCSQDEEYKTSLRPVVKELDVNVGSGGQNPRKGGPKRNSAVRPQVRQANSKKAYAPKSEAQTGGVLQLLLGIVLVSAVIGGLVWFLFLS